MRISIMGLFNKGAGIFGAYGFHSIDFVRH